MCNGASTRTTQGGSIAVLHPVHHLQRTPSSSSISSSSCGSSDDENQQLQEPNEILVFFTNSLSKESGTNVEVHGLHEQLNHQEGYIVIHRDGDLSSPTCKSTQDSTALCSFAIQVHERSWALEQKLNLGVGDTGIIGRRVSVVTAAREMLAQGIVGWN